MSSTSCSRPHIDQSRARCAALRARRTPRGLGSADLAASEAWRGCARCWPACWTSSRPARPTTTTRRRPRIRSSRSRRGRHGPNTPPDRACSSPSGHRDRPTMPAARAAAADITSGYSLLSPHWRPQRLQRAVGRRSARPVHGRQTVPRSGNRVTHRWPTPAGAGSRSRPAPPTHRPEPAGRGKRRRGHCRRTVSTVRRCRRTPNRSATSSASAAPDVDAGALCRNPAIAALSLTGPDGHACRRAARPCRRG
jgi:hypothetical protein